jgi:hypothetical protein
VQQQRVTVTVWFPFASSIETYRWILTQVTALEFKRNRAIKIKKKTITILARVTPRVDGVVYT